MSDAEGSTDTRRAPPEGQPVTHGGIQMSTRLAAALPNSDPQGHGGSVPPVPRPTLGKSWVRREGARKIRGRSASGVRIVAAGPGSRCRDRMLPYRTGSIQPDLSTQEVTPPLDTPENTPRQVARPPRT